MATRNASDLLEELCQRTKLDCDTMDLDFVKEFTAKRGKFADCTSNQVSYLSWSFYSSNARARLTGAL